MNNRKLCNSTSSSELQRRVISVALYRLIPARIVCYRLRAMQFLLYPSPSTSYLDSTTIHNLLSSQISIRFLPLVSRGENRSMRKIKKKGRGKKEKENFHGSELSRLEVEAKRQRNETVAIGAIYAISRCQPAPVFLSLIDRPPREKA